MSDTQMQDSPEFKAAVQAAASDAARIAAEEVTQRLMATLKSQSGPQAENGMMEMLAMAIAQLTDQGTGRKRIAPEVLKAQLEAREEMDRLLLDLRKRMIAAERARVMGTEPAHVEIPRYGLLGEVYLDEQMIQPLWLDSRKAAQRTEIEWPGPPNEQMIPLNASANAIHDQFLLSIGHRTDEGVFKKEFGITPRGVVVHGGAASGHRHVNDDVLSTGAGSQRVGMKVHDHDNAGSYKPVRVLGTIADPARQTA